MRSFVRSKRCWACIGTLVALATMCGRFNGKTESGKARTNRDGKDKRFVRRGAKGRFKESDDVGRSLKRDRQQKAKRKVKSWREIGGTR